MSEPGIKRFLEERELSGASEESRYQYVEHIGSVRTLAGKPILELTASEMRELDKKLLGRAKVV